MTIRNEDAIDNNKNEEVMNRKYTNADLVKDMRHVQMFSFDFFFCWLINEIFLICFCRLLRWILYYTVGFIGCTCDWILKRLKFGFVIDTFGV